MNAPTCITCGDELDPQRAEKYDYCTKPACRERNAKPATILAVGVNKAADQYVLLNDRVRREAASGRYKKEPDAASASTRTLRRPVGRTPKPTADPVAPSSASAGRRRWSQTQENLARTYQKMGLTPDAIAKKLGLTPYLVTQILLTADRA